MVNASAEITARFPTPVGGFPDSRDRVPSILFAILYLCIVPVGAMRLIRRESRTWVHIGTCTFALERIVVYSLRAWQSFDDGHRYAAGLLEYTQMSFACGYLVVTQDLIPLFRVLLINYTNGPDEIESVHRDPACDGQAMSELPPDDPKRRGRLRLWTFLFNISFITVNVPNLVQGSMYDNAVVQQKAADAIQILRYMATSAGLLLSIALLVWIYLWRDWCWPRPAVLRLCQILMLLLPISFYRLVAMRHYIPSPDYIGPGSQSTTTDHVIFYVLHGLPEWLAATLLITPNTRRMFRAGLDGDWRRRDGQQKYSCGERRKAKKARYEHEMVHTTRTTTASRTELKERTSTSTVDRIV
ncbi:hypothetical protein BKA62DRAFT_620517 [Auriculariales sp. MPI-PUGE-AT-0066]|nr:hypothetical protein BKA62DRAFT_620517 [Auriculariales sp. MPI-PUGE-AT-0066]